MSGPAREAAAWAAALFRSIPGEIGCTLRRVWHGWPAGVRVLDGVRIHRADRLELAPGVQVNSGVQIQAAGGVRIGARTLVGPNTLIWSINHRFVDPAVPVADQGYDEGPVEIGSDVWIAAACVVLPGVTIGDGAVVAAGAVVTRDVPGGALVAGVPARVIGRRSHGGDPRGGGRDVSRHSGPAPRGRGEGPAVPPS